MEEFKIECRDKKYHITIPDDYRAPEFWGRTKDFGDLQVDDLIVLLKGKDYIRLIAFPIKSVIKSFQVSDDGKKAHLYGTREVNRAFPAEVGNLIKYNKVIGPRPAEKLVELINLEGEWDYITKTQLGPSLTIPNDVLDELGMLKKLKKEEAGKGKSHSIDIVREEVSQKSKDPDYTYHRI